MADETKPRKPRQRRSTAANSLRRLGLGSLGIAAAGTAAFCLSVSLAECAVRTFARGECRQARPLSARFRHARRELGNLHHSLAGRLLLAECGVHAPGLPDGVEAGTGHHCLPLSRQQVQTRRRKDRRPCAQAAALEAHLAQRRRRSAGGPLYRHSALAAGFVREGLRRHGENSRPIFRRPTRHAGVALDLPQRHGLEHPEARAGDPAECLSAPVLDQGAYAHAELQRNVVSGHADAGDIFYSGRDRNSADALLPSVRAAGLRRHEGSAVRGFVRIISAQSASLVGALPWFFWCSRTCSKCFIAAPTGRRASSIG